MSELLLRNAPFFLAGLEATLVLAGWTMLLGTLLALPVALLRYLEVPILSPLCGAYMWFIRGTPLLVVLLLCYFALPVLFGYRTTASAAALVGFIVFLAAYAAQDMLTGLRSVSRGLIEAGEALGLTRVQVIRHVVLPLGGRIAVPALFGQYVRMFKYTSVASALGATELTGSILLVNGRVFQPFPLLAAGAVVYLVVCLTISMTGRWLHQRLIPRFPAPAARASGMEDGFSDGLE
jgi:His/Glu/Gln/Arg/opine family amino acid ABC transporter permease subunit